MHTGISLMLNSREHFAAALMVAVFCIPAGVQAADLGTLTSIEHGGAVINSGNILVRSDISSITDFWRFNFSWPNSVPNNRAYLAVFRGTFGSVHGGSLQNGVNYAATVQAWGSGQQSIQKQFVLPPLGNLDTESGTYTVLVAELPFSGYTGNDLLQWFAAGGAAGTREPYQYAMFSFEYRAEDHVVELPNAIAEIQYADRIIKKNEAVYRTEVNPSLNNPSKYWRFRFTWPNAVPNQQALFMIFKGTFGSIDGGTPSAGVNYFSNLQAWGSGAQEIGKFLNLQLEEAVTGKGIYTVLIAERDPKYVSAGVSQEAEWFATGGSGGVAPRKFTTLTFEYRADDPYPVIIVPGILGSAQNLDGEWVLDPITHVYDNLYETLDANWYTSGETLFAFPYDWRRSNVDTASLLRDKINTIQSICNCMKVDIVAHSMGGLVARQYAQSSAYEGDINKLIFLGTPHLGAPKAYLMWEAGVFDSDILGLVLKSILTLEAYERGYQNLFEYIRGYPITSVRELLPVYSYLFNEGNSLKVYPAEYPTNPFLESLRGSVDNLVARGIEVHNFVGETPQDDTIVSLQIKESTIPPFWPDGMPVGLFNPLGYSGVDRGDGDNTVPLVSAIWNLNSNNVASSHSVLPSAVQGVLFSLLTSKDPDQIISKGLVQRILVIRIFSPADLIVTDSLGRRIGNGISNEIPGAYYTGAQTDSEFITIPNPIDGEYHIGLQGADSGGKVTVAASLLSDSSERESTYTLEIAPNQTMELVAKLEESSADPINIGGLDFDPPTIEILEPKAKEYVRSDTISSNVLATDDGSGIKEVKYEYDRVATSSTSFQMLFEKLGEHTFSATASDTAGNIASAEEIFSLGVTPESLIWTIGRLYELGHISSFRSSAQLQGLVKTATKSENIVGWPVSLSPRGPRLRPNAEYRIDRAIMRTLTKELEKLLKNGTITRSAYEIIKSDVEWLLNHEKLNY